jgi:hypothetical protein
VTAEVAEDVLVCAASIFESIREEGYAVKGPLLVNRLGKPEDRALVPDEPHGIDADIKRSRRARPAHCPIVERKPALTRTHGAEVVPENVVDQEGLLPLLLAPGSSYGHILPIERSSPAVA